jgi:hypothetical protein
MGWHLTHALALIFAAYPPLTAITSGSGKTKAMPSCGHSFAGRHPRSDSLMSFQSFTKWPLLCTVKNRKQ